MQDQTACEPSVPLPEVPAPPHTANCRDCEAAGLHTRLMWGEGNANARIMLLLDNPGAREDREGNPFVCGTRDTLLAGLREAGIARDEVFVTYLLKRRPTRAYDKPQARRLCMRHLRDQLTSMQPHLLFGFGNVVAQALLDDEEAEVKRLRGRWHEFAGAKGLHGLWHDHADAGGLGFTYHPLAVRRRPNLLPYFLQDLRMLAERAPDHLEL